MAHSGPGQTLVERNTKIHRERPRADTQQHLEGAASGRWHNTLVKDVGVEDAAREVPQSSAPAQVRPALAENGPGEEDRVKHVENLRANGNHKLAARKGLTLCNGVRRHSPLSEPCESALGPPGGAIPFLYKLHAQSQQLQLRRKQQRRRS